MIAGIFHEGSGLGDQLFRYITVRTLAEEKGFDFCMWHDRNFKGKEFMKLDMGPYYPSPGTAAKWNELDLRLDGVDRRSFDPEINFVEDNTIIDGSFEDDKYWRHNLENINKWLAVEPLQVPGDTCVIGFRGGEYALNPDLFLPPSYFAEAMRQMPASVSRYEVHTDDPALARQTFKGSMFSVIDNQPISHSKHTNMGYNWRSARYAKYAIIPNSAFFILPRILKHLEDPTAVTIAPRYWAGRNTKVWKRPACFYKEFLYI